MSRGANNCVQRVFEKKKHLFYNYISPHFKILLCNERLDFILFFYKRSKGLAMQINFHSLF